MSKPRSKNVTQEEKEILLRFIKPKLAVIENLKTDGATNKMKALAWEDITSNYNALQTTGLRSAIQLKALFDVIKRKTKKEKSSEKVSSYISSNPQTITEREKELLVDLISSNKISVDPSVGSEAQVQAWQTIAETYNQFQTSGVKTIEELQKINTNVYKSAKSDFNYEKRNTYKTGGGQTNFHLSTISGKVIGMMGDRYQSLKAPHDSDGDFPSSSVNLTEHNDDQFIEIVDDNSPIYLEVSPDDLCTDHDMTGISSIQPVKTLKFNDTLGYDQGTRDILTIEDQGKQGSFKIGTSTPQAKVSTARVPPKKVYDNITELTNRKLTSCETKDKLINENSILKKKLAEKKLEILEIEKLIVLEKLKTEREPNLSSKAK